MNKIIALFVCMLFLPIVGKAVASEELSVVLRSKFIYHGTEFETIVTESDLANSPKWKEEEAFPPLSPRVAVKNSSIYVRTVLNLESFILDSILINRIGPVGHWIYQVEYTPLADSGALDGFEFPIKILVLMNGKVLPPKILSASKEGNLAPLKSYDLPF